MSAPLFSNMAANLIGSEVLKIAGEITALKNAGTQVLNFTVGDFDPQYFPIPEELKQEILASLNRNETNYPPSSGVPQLREVLASFYTRELKIPTKPSEVLVAGGARPLIYTIYMALLDPGDSVVFPVPSWNNNHYCHLARAKAIAVSCKAENGFLPTAKDIEPYVKTARLLCLNSPLNPTGTVFKREQLKEICDLLVNENKRRHENNERPIFLMYDQIYWKITHSNATHFNPIELCPDIKPHTIFVDGISKYFCGTGLRVGWSVLPENLMGPFSSILGHVGAWAPKPEQIATAKFLNMTQAQNTFIQTAREKLSRRLFPFYEGVLGLKTQGLPVDVVRPEGAIYLSLRIKPTQKLPTNESLRRALLEKAGIAVVPFQAFGLMEDSGWFRLSMGAVSEAECVQAVDKLKNFLLTQS